MTLNNALTATTTIAMLALSVSAEAKTLRLNHNNPKDHPVHISMQMMADEVAAATDGAVKIRIYPNGQLGSQRESTEQVQNCSLDMARSNTSELEAFSKNYGVFNLPYIFANEEHFNSVITGDIGQEILRSSLDEGFLGLAYYTEGARSFYANKPILSPADLNGVKMRVQPSPSAVRMVELLGANPTPISWGELYSALQQGVVDGAENNPTALTTARHGEVVKHFSLDEHTMIPSVVFISSCAWNDLSDEQQAALSAAAKNSMAFHTTEWRKASEAAVEEAMRELDVQFHEVDKAPFVEAVQPMYDEARSRSPELGELISRIQTAAE